VEVNNLLAHLPWKLKTEHIDKLLKGQDAWSKPELIHAILVFASYRALAGFVWGTGITSEIDFQYQDCLLVSENEDLTSSNRSQHTREEIHKLCDRSDIIDENEAQAKKVESFAAVEKIDPEAKNTPNPSVLLRSGWHSDLEKRYSFNNSAVKYYVDFDVRSHEYHIFHIQDYSWATRGFSLVTRYFPMGAHPIDDCFKCIKSLTYNTFGNLEDMDTTGFRMAIWHYVNRIFGIFYDDYNYENVNKKIPQVIKAYVKIISVAPWRITAGDILNWPLPLLPQEKIHIALITLEARKNAELLYALHAIDKSRI